MSVRAVTFDYWNTLIAETDAPFELRRALWRALLAEAGREVSDEQLDEAFKEAWRLFDARWRANQPVEPARTARDATSHLGIEPESALGQELTAAYIDASHSVPRELLPNVGEVLEALRRRGVAVGVVCDVGAVHSPQLRQWLGDLGVLELIDHFSFSDEVGVFKPDQRIFRHALEGLGVDVAANAAHVGDLRRTDVAGARALGMASVRYTGGREDTEEGHDEADHVIGDHLELLVVLDIE